MTALGNGRFDVQCFDGVKRQAHVRGKMRKQVYVAVVSVSFTPDFKIPRVLLKGRATNCGAQGDIVLISLRDFQDGKADIIDRYSADEARELRKLGFLPAAGKFVLPAVVKMVVSILTFLIRSPSLT